MQSTLSGSRAPFQGVPANQTVSRPQYAQGYGQSGTYGQAGNYGMASQISAPSGGYGQQMYSQQQYTTQQQYPTSMTPMGTSQLLRPASSAITSQLPTQIPAHQIASHFPSQLPASGQIGNKMRTNYTTMTYAPMGSEPLKAGGQLLQYFSPVYPVEKVPMFEYPVEVRISGPSLMGQWRSSLQDLAA